MIRKSQRAYATYLKALEFHGILPGHLRKLILGSTRWSWRKKHPSRFFGFDSSLGSAMFKVLKPTYFALSKLLVIYHRVVSQVRGLNSSIARRLWIFPGSKSS